MKQPPNQVNLNNLGVKVIKSQSVKYNEI